MRIRAILLVVVVMAAMLGNPFTHALIPHEHTHGHESVSNDMHAALRHEDKKLLLALIADVPWVALALLLLSHVQRISLPISAPLAAPSYLRRGIALHRRFG